MKRTLSALALVLVMCAGGFLAHAATSPSGTKKLVSGQVTCLFCYMSKPAGEELRADCAEHCITKRDMAPVLLEEGTGNAYVLVWKDGNSPVAKVTPLLGVKVNAQGSVYEKGGVRVLEVSMIAEAL